MRAALSTTLKFRFIVFEFAGVEGSLHIPALSKAHVIVL